MKLIMNTEDSTFTRVGEFPESPGDKQLFVTFNLGRGRYHAIITLIFPPPPQTEGVGEKKQGYTVDICYPQDEQQSIELMGGHEKLGKAELFEELDTIIQVETFLAAELGFNPRVKTQIAKIFGLLGP